MSTSIKIEVGIFIKSSNNKIASGFTSINMNALKVEQGRKKYNLTQCPDKNGCVEATITYNVLSETNYSTEGESSPQLISTSRSGIFRSPKNKYYSLVDSNTG
jgi:hypothetical protein